MKTLTGLIFSLLLCLPLAARAAPDLLSGSAPVADESPEARNAALQTLLGQVMVRLSGQREVLSSPAAAKVLAHAPDLVQQFRYRNAPAADGAPQKRLQVRFDGAALRRLMSAEGLPLWNGPRPRVLLWAALEQGANRRLLNPGDNPGVQTALLERARARGMPLQLPLMDLEDQAALNVADIWADYDVAIRKASARYPHDLVLTARVREQAGGQYAADWTLWRDSGNQNFDTRGQNLAQVLAAGIDAAQDLLARRLAVQAVSDRDAVRLWVEGVDSLTGYSRLMGLLRTLPGVRGVLLRESGRDGLLLALLAPGGRAAVDAALRDQPGLSALPAPSRPQGEPAPDSAPQADLYYTLLPAGPGQ